MGSPNNWNRGCPWLCCLSVNSHKWVTCLASVGEDVPSPAVTYCARVGWYPEGHGEELYEGASGGDGRFQLSVEWINTLIEKRKTQFFHTAYQRWKKKELSESSGISFYKWSLPQNPESNKLTKLSSWIWISKIKKFHGSKSFVFKNKTACEPWQFKTHFVKKRKRKKKLFVSHVSYQF